MLCLEQNMYIIYSIVLSLIKSDINYGRYIYNLEYEQVRRQR